MKKLKYFKILLRYLKNEKLLIALYIILSVIMYASPVLGTLVWADMYEALSEVNLHNFLILIVINGALNILCWSILDYPINRIFNRLQANFMSEINRDLYKKINDLPSIAFEEIGTGEFVNRMYTDPNNILDLLSLLIKLSTRLVTAVVFVFITFTISVSAGLELIGLCGSMFIFANIYYPKIKKNHEEIKKVSDKYVKDITENISGVREIKALGIKKTINNNVNNTIINLFNKEKKQSNDESMYHLLNNGTYFIIQTIIYITVGLEVMHGNTSLAGFVLINNIIYRVDEAVERLNEFGINFNKVSVALKRLGEILDNKLYKDEKYGRKVIKDKDIILEFKDVHFRYRKNEDYVLKGLNMKIVPHKKIAIVGRSGEGKSTLFNLLLRYFEPNKGEILINNQKLSSLTEDSLRENISIIRQTPFLFNDTIFNNFKVVKEDITLEEIREVCKKAYIDDYIMGLKDQYNTTIGEGGVNLSGGQKQRLAIARTLLKNTKVILFDEATSALDNESQEYIKKTIDDLVKDHTIIIVAHRLSTIMDADLIYIVNKGIVTGKGTHSSLIKDNEEYRNLYQKEVIE